MEQKKHGRGLSWTPEEVEILRQGSHEELTAAEISDRLKAAGYDRPRSAVYDKANAADIPIRRREKGPPEKIIRQYDVYVSPKTPWPEDMPHFEDHPKAAKEKTGGNALKTAARHAGEAGAPQSGLG